MLAETLIADLDQSLATDGQTVTLKRRIGSGATFVSVTCKASLRGYEPRDWVNGVQQTDARFIMSPSEINAAAAAWPGAAGGGTWPKIGDFLEVLGKLREIKAVQPIVDGDTVVRVEGRVLG